ACFPCFNDAQTIAKMVRDADRALRVAVPDVELVVVDDGSTDDSVDRLRDLEREITRLRVVVHGDNRGYGAALISAFAAATKEWIFYTDGDAQYDACESVNLVAMVDDDVDVVQGWKIGRGDSLYRKVIGRVYHHLVAALFRLRVRDTDCDFRLFRRALLDDV